MVVVYFRTHGGERMVASAWRAAAGM